MKWTAVIITTTLAVALAVMPQPQPPQQSFNESDQRQISRNTARLDSAERDILELKAWRIAHDSGFLLEQTDKEKRLTGVELSVGHIESLLEWAGGVLGVLLLSELLRWARWVSTRVPPGKT